MTDVNHEINTVERRIGSRTLEAGEARVLTIARVYDTTPEDMWDACTNPERIARWFLPVSGDLQVGGRYEFQGNASGTIERCERPHAVDATWEYGGQISWVELRLMPEASKTRFMLEHIAHVDDDLWAQFGPGAVGVGWDGGIAALTRHLEGQERAEIEAWAASPEGLEFNRRSSDAWTQASIAFGTDPDEAQAAGERTTEFYTPA